MNMFQKPKQQYTDLILTLAYNADEEKRSEKKDHYKTLQRNLSMFFLATTNLLPFRDEILINYDKSSSNATASLKASLDRSDKRLSFLKMFHDFFTFIRFPVESTNYYKNKVGITAWSHPAWYIIHYCGYYTEYAKKTMKKEDVDRYFACIIMSLQYLIPCPKCRIHYRENIKKILERPKNTRNPVYKFADPFGWTVELHNIVTTFTNKEQNTRKKLYTREEALKEVVSNM